MFCRGEYPRPRRVFDDAIITKDRDKRYHDYQQPLTEALLYVGTLTRPKAVVCDPFLGSGTTACAVARRVRDGGSGAERLVHQVTRKERTHRSGREPTLATTGPRSAPGRPPGR